MPHSLAAGTCARRGRRGRRSRRPSPSAIRRAPRCAAPATGLLMVSSASRPAKPFALVAIGRLCKAEKFSTLIHDGHSVVKPQATPAAMSLRADRFDLGPGLRRRLRIEAGRAELILVVVEDRRRRVERKRQHVAGHVGVIAGDGRQVGGRIERHRPVAHQLVAPDRPRPSPPSWWRCRPPPPARSPDAGGCAARTARPSWSRHSVPCRSGRCGIPTATR